MGMTIDQELTEISDLALKIKANYLAKLKVEKIAMLTELLKEIEKQSKIPNSYASAYNWNNGVYACYKVIQQKIDKMKGTN